MPELLVVALVVVAVLFVAKVFLSNPNGGF